MLVHRIRRGTPVAEAPRSRDDPGDRAQVQAQSPGFRNGSGHRTLQTSLLRAVDYRDGSWTGKARRGGAQPSLPCWRVPVLRPKSSTVGVLPAHTTSALVPLITTRSTSLT